LIERGKGVTVTTSTSLIILASGQLLAITVTIDATKKAEKRDYTGFIIVTDSTGQILRVPYWIRFRKNV